MTTASNINCQQSAYSTALYKNRLIATQLVSLFLIHLVGILFRKQPIKPARLFSNLQKLVLLDHILVAHASLFSWHPVEWLFPFPVENIVCVSLFRWIWSILGTMKPPKCILLAFGVLLSLYSSNGRLFPRAGLGRPSHPCSHPLLSRSPSLILSFLATMGFDFMYVSYVYPLIWYMYHNTMVPRYTGNAFESENSFGNPWLWVIFALHIDRKGLPFPVPVPFWNISTSTGYCHW